MAGSEPHSGLIEGLCRVRGHSLQPASNQGASIALQECFLTTRDLIHWPSFADAESAPRTKTSISTGFHTKTVSSIYVMGPAEFLKGPSMVDFGNCALIA
jgi:hypothetical protein